MTQAAETARTSPTVVPAPPLLGVRNLDRVELVLNNEVHPYDLLRYERAIFSKAAIEQLTDSLVKSVSKRSAAQTEAA